MSFSVETNRLIELRDLANRTFEERARQQALEQPAKRSGVIMLTALSSRAPTGTVEPDYKTSTGRTVSHARFQFVDDALRERKGMLVSQLKTGMRTVIGPVRRFFR